MRNAMKVNTPYEQAKTAESKTAALAEFFGWSATIHPNGVYGVDATISRAGRIFQVETEHRYSWSTHKQFPFSPLHVPLRKQKSGLMDTIDAYVSWNSYLTRFLIVDMGRYRADIAISHTIGKDLSGASETFIAIPLNYCYTWGLSLPSGWQDPFGFLLKDTEPHTQGGLF